MCKNIMWSFLCSFWVFEVRPKNVIALDERLLLLRGASILYICMAWTEHIFPQSIEFIAIWCVIAAAAFFSLL